MELKRSKTIVGRNHVQFTRNHKRGNNSSAANTSLVAFFSGRGVKNDSLSLRGLHDTWRRLNATYPDKHFNIVFNSGEPHLEMIKL
jgi:hypothetical protein